MLKKVIDILKIVVNKYELKHPEYTKPVFICPNIRTRNAHKNDKYKIPEDQPQCPVYKDNRCCGGCSFAAMCDHCVECHCYGFTYAQMGGTDKGYYLHKASNYYELGRLKDNGEFDWDYYKVNARKSEIQKGKFVYIRGRIYMINSPVNKHEKFSVISCETSKHRRFRLRDIEGASIYDNFETAKLWEELMEVKNEDSDRNTRRI